MKEFILFIVLTKLPTYLVEGIDSESVLQRPWVHVAVNVTEFGIIRLQVFDLCVGTLFAPLAILDPRTIWYTHTIELVRSRNVSERYVQFIKRTSSLSINLICV